MWHHRMWVTGMLKSGFRTIQVSPKDCPAALRQTDHEVDRPDGRAKAGGSSMSNIRRREFIPFLGSAAVMWPLGPKSLCR